ncbi:hypothetical protein [Bacillus salipaludis]|uniref:Uncharacterized protein n=1 Tax=Bacillus salipaludis TaxID=2547811 RepID=A0AA90QWW5_9BACI|nr:hypothetical protein [Bacillus salipaludis]MDQ6598279.1 hypothetical protein [Bacillus salipaludis]
MQSVKELISFSTTISESTDPNEFLIQFSSCESFNEREKPIKLTKNFDELIDFLEELEQ